MCSWRLTSPFFTGKLLLTITNSARLGSNLSLLPHGSKFTFIDRRPTNFRQLGGPPIHPRIIVRTFGKLAVVIGFDTRRLDQPQRQILGFGAFLALFRLNIRLSPRNSFVIRSILVYAISKV